MKTRDEIQEQFAELIRTLLADGVDRGELLICIFTALGQALHIEEGERCDSIDSRDATLALPVRSA